MAVRIKESETPYRGGIGIEITNNHIINVLLREANNLIHVNDNNELYVDLQLPDGIEPDDDFPVGVTTGKILQADGWQQSGLILNRKTTSGDYARLIYANDGNVYIDCGDGIWRLLGGEGTRCNTRTFWIESNQDLDIAQQVYDWIKAGNNALIIHDIGRGPQCYTLSGEKTIGTTKDYQFASHYESFIDGPHGYTTISLPIAQIGVDMTTDEVTYIVFSSMRQNSFIDPTATSMHYDNAFIPTEPFHPTTKQYVDDELLKKQDLLTAGTRITIQTDPNTGDLVISADVSGVMTYKGNVTDPSQLPASGNVGDCWYSESDGHLYAWDGTQWKDIGGITPNLTNYFNKQTDDSDDITQGSIHLFVTQQEKNTWNNKQDKLTAGSNITIDPLTNEISATDTKYYAGNNITIDQTNHIHNDAPFEPDNAGSMGQVLTKTSNGYEWKNPGGGGGSYTGGHGININSNNVISNSLPFEPDNGDGRSGQVLKTDGHGTYYWDDESGGGGGHNYTAGDGINIDSNYVISNTNRFIPSNDQTATAGQMLVKTQNGYEWSNLPSNKNNVKFWTIDWDNQVTATNREIYEWLQASPNNGAIINIKSTNTTDYDDTYIFENINQSGTCIFHGISRNSEKREWMGSGGQSRGWYTIAWQWELQLFGPGLTNYGIVIWENQNDLTHTNYISALGAQYPSAFMPTDDTQPATKGYVDAAVLGGGSGALGITNNVSGTTTRITQIWGGTTAEWNAIQNPSNTCIYIELE